MGVYSGPNSEEDGLVLAIDVGNKKSFSPNVFPRGTDIYGWYVDTKGDANAANSTLSRDTISSPVGNTPLKMAVTNNDPHIFSYNSSIWNLANAASGETWTISVYVKASQSTTGELLIFGANSGGTYVEIPNTTVNISTSWTRVSYTGTFSNANTAFLQMRLDGPQSGGTGINVWWDGLQIERGSTATEFTKEYTLDSSFNERTLDLSGNSDNGTLQSVISYNSDNGGYLNFNGSTDYITLPEISIAGNEISFDVLNYGITSQTSSIIYLTDSNEARLLNVHLPWSNSTVYFDKGGDPSYDRIFKSVSNSEYQGWHYWAFTANASTGSMKIYLDGFLWHSGTGKNKVINDVTGTTRRIGITTENDYHRGYISNLKLYKKELTASEVQQNFNALRGRYGI